MAHVAYDDRALYDNRLLLWSELQTIVQSNWETVMTVSGDGCEWCSCVVMVVGGV